MCRGSFPGGAGEEVSSRRKLPRRWPPARKDAAASLESSGAWGAEAFPRYFSGEPRDGCADSCRERQRGQLRAVGLARS